MSEIMCPNCGKAFQVDEAGYAAILKQVRDKEFSKELEERREQFEVARDTAVKLARAESEKTFQDAIARRDAQIAELEAGAKLAVSEAVAAKEVELANRSEEITALKARLDLQRAEQQRAVTEAVSQKDQELAKKNEEIVSLHGQIQNLDGKIENSRQAFELKEKSLKETYEEKLKDKDEQIAYYRDLKAKQSTKMVGETLEQHCEIEFNKIRAAGFSNAYFEKDNDARSGSKGDFIFRESDGGVEFISIMFEMKNENDETATKHKNEDFLKELDKDRREKNCEYAVLVSLLEADNDLYNQGIVDVSHRYPRMYVIRPQFFIPLITLLRNAALNSLSWRRQLAVIKSQNVDVTNFEERMNEFKKRFSEHFRLAGERFQDAVTEIDKTIDHLQKIRKALLTSEKHLNRANSDIEGLTIKSLTDGNPTMTAKFAKAAEARQLKMPEV